MNNIDNLEGLDEIFYGLEDEALGFTPDTDKPKKIETKKIKKNRFGLTEKEAELVCLLLCGGLFIILFSSSLIGYMFYYFSL